MIILYIMNIYKFTDLYASVHNSFVTKKLPLRSIIPWSVLTQTVDVWSDTF